MTANELSSNIKRGPESIESKKYVELADGHEYPTMTALNANAGLLDIESNLLDKYAIGSERGVLENPGLLTLDTNNSQVNLTFKPHANPSVE